MTDDEVKIRLRLDEVRKFIADSGRAEKSVKGIGDATERADRRGRSSAVGFNMMRSSVSRLTTTVKLASIAVLGFATLGVGAAISSFAEAEVIGAKLNQIIKATGGVARVSAAHVGKMADMLSLKTGIDDEAITSGAALLLTFKGVRNEVGASGDIFDRAMRAALDLSTVSGKPLETSILAIGKALQDPAKGAAALSKQGSLAKTELEALKKMAASGAPVWKQQEFILAALEGQYQGTAEAAGNTFTGALNRAKVMAGNLAEGLGGVLAPGLHKIIDAATTAAGSFTRARDAGARMGFAIATAMDAAAGGGTRFRDAFVVLEDIAGKVWTGLTNVASGAWDIVNAFLPSKSGAEDTGDAIKNLGTKVMDATEEFRDFGAWLRNGSTGAQRLKKFVVVATGAVVAWRAAVILATAASWAWGGAMAIASGIAAIQSGVLTIAIVALYVWGGAVKAAAAVSRAWTIAMVALNVAMYANPIGLIVIAIAAAVAAVALGIVYWKQLTDASWKLKLIIALLPFGALALTVAHVTKAFKNHGAILDWVKGKLTAVWDYIKGLPGRIRAISFSGIFDGFKDAARDAFNWVLDHLRDIDMSIGPIKIPGAPDIPGLSIRPFAAMPHLAMGGVLTSGGSVVVGDGGNGSGAEVVDLPRAARVRPLTPDERGVRTFTGGAGSDSAPRGRMRLAGDVYLEGRKVGTVIAEDTEDDLARR